MYAGNILTIKCHGPTFSWLKFEEIGPCTLGRYRTHGDFEQGMFSSSKDLPAFEKVQHCKCTMELQISFLKPSILPTICHIFLLEYSLEQ